MQVVVSEEEMERFRQAARALGLSLSEWVRQVLRDAESGVSSGDIGAKLDAVRAAVQHSFPAGDIDQMLDEISEGRATTELP